MVAVTATPVIELEQATGVVSGSALKTGVTYAPGAMVGFIFGDDGGAANQVVVPQAPAAAPQPIIINQPKPELREPVPIQKKPKRVKSTLYARCLNHIATRADRKLSNVVKTCERAYKAKKTRERRLALDYAKTLLKKAQTKRERNQRAGITKPKIRNQLTPEYFADQIVGKTLQYIGGDSVSMRMLATLTAKLESNICADLVQMGTPRRGRAAGCFQMETIAIKDAALRGASHIKQKVLDAGCQFNKIQLVGNTFCDVSLMRLYYSVTPEPLPLPTDDAEVFLDYYIRNWCKGCAASNPAYYKKLRNKAHEILTRLRNHYARAGLISSNSTTPSRTSQAKNGNGLPSTAASRSADRTAKRNDRATARRMFRPNC